MGTSVLSLQFQEKLLSRDTSLQTLWGEGSVRFIRRRPFQLQSFMAPQVRTALLRFQGLRAACSIHSRSFLRLQPNNILCHKIQGSQKKLPLNFALSPKYLDPVFALSVSPSLSLFCQAFQIYFIASGREGIGWRKKGV